MFPGYGDLDDDDDVERKWQMGQSTWTWVESFHVLFVDIVVFSVLVFFAMIFGTSSCLSSSVDASIGLISILPRGKEVQFPASRCRCRCQFILLMMMTGARM
jgi:hypothetical protein